MRSGKPLAPSIHSVRPCQLCGIAPCAPCCATLSGSAHPVTSLSLPGIAAMSSSELAVYRANLRAVPAALALALCTATSCAQELRLRDSSGYLAATYDAARNRMIALGRQGDTIEWDGTHWLHRAAPLIDVQSSWQAMAYDPNRGRPLMLGLNPASDLATMVHDGVEWQTIMSPTQPSGRTGWAMAYDSARDELVLFGGRPAWQNWVDLADTWVFDGANWTQKTPAVSPPARSAVACYDTARARVVLFGGAAGPSQQTLFDDTWEWDGATWSMVQIANAPQPRVPCAITYDAGRSRTVMFGGFLGAGLTQTDVWEYDGTNWVQVASTTPSPSYRSGAAFAYDQATSECVLLGGSNGGLRAQDMWSWNGTRWQLLSQQTQPYGMGQGTTTATPSGDGVLYLEQSLASPSPQTMVWNGTSWAAVAGTAPTLLTDFALTTGPSMVYRYGGYDPVASLYVSDLWGWDGTNWQLLSNQGPVDGPGAAICYDWVRGELLLFGGVDNANNAMAETWVWNGTAWQQRFPATAPPARAGAQMAFDLARSVLMMRSGAPQLNDTWEWNGIDWSAVTTPQPPAAVHSLAFDVQRGEVVMVSQSPPGMFWTFHGQSWVPLPIADKILASPGAIGWPYTKGLLIADFYNLFSLSSTAATATYYGAACTTGALDLAANSWPRPGTAGFGIDILRGPGNSLVALLGAVSAASVNLAGCTLLVPPGQAVTLLATSPTGFATSPLPIPNHSAFVGIDLFFQAATLDATAPNGFTLSRGLRVGIGD
jgi:hypothetical protein